MATRLGSHVEGAGAIGYDVAAAEEGTTQDTPPDTRPGYETERPGGDAPAATTPPPTSATPAWPPSRWSTRGRTDEEPERLDRPGPQEPGVQEGIYDQDADQARQQRPSDS